MNRRFALLAGIGCLLLFLVIVVAVPGALILAFRNLPSSRVLSQANTPVPIPQIGPGAQATQAVVPTFPAKPAPELPVTGPVKGNIPISSDILTTLYQQLNPGVVSIDVSMVEAGQVGQGAGSGFIIDDQGHIVTNNHVVAGAQSVVVTFFDGSQVSAEIVGTDENSDLAVIHVDAIPKGAHPLPLGDSDQVKPGEFVVAIGNPFRQSGSMTLGIVSAIGRNIPSGLTPFNIPQAIQTDAAINPGNSGGPLLNLSGQVIGVNAQIETNGNVQANAGVGFSIPSNIVRKVAPALIANGSIEWPWLGVEGTDVGLLIAQANNLKDQNGAYIDNVVAGSPAASAGLQGSSGQTDVGGLPVPVGGDVITSVDGNPIKNFDELLVYIASKNPGDQLTLTVLRGGQTSEIKVTLAPRPANFNPNSTSP